MAAWWVSWYSPAPLSTFELHSPWWVSGYRMAEPDDVSIICAAVLADDEDAARALVVAAYDEPPADIEWRFTDPLEGSPFSDRFPKNELWHAWDPEAGKTCNCPDHRG